MNILQLIDSLHGGGAERMAVNFANAFDRAGDASFLVATRAEGSLKKYLKKEVAFLCLHKSSVLDFRALYQLRTFVKKNKIDVIQAHGSTFFTAVLLKIICWRVQLYWHDHNGNRAGVSGSINKYIIWCSAFFDGVLCVNPDLKSWADQHLKTKNNHFVPNFTAVNTNEAPETQLHGTAAKRILCLANLREPKNHQFLLEGFQRSKIASRGWSLHLVGADYQNTYSKALKEAVVKHQIEHSVFLYGGCQDVFHIMKQADVGVLVSTSEGFPVTLLEYGLSDLVVIGSDVGFNSAILSEHRGYLINPLDVQDLSATFNQIVEDWDLAVKTSQNLKQYVKEHYSETAVIKRLKHILC